MLSKLKSPTLWFFLTIVFLRSEAVIPQAIFSHIEIFYLCSSALLLTALIKNITFGRWFVCEKVYYKYVFGLTLLIMITMLVHGFGLSIAGSSEFGGKSYLILLLSLWLILESGSVRLSVGQWGGALILMCCMGMVIFEIDSPDGRGISHYLSGANEGARFTYGAAMGFSLLLLVYVALVEKRINALIKYLMLAASFILIGMSGHRIAFISAFLFVIVLNLTGSGSHRKKIKFIFKGFIIFLVLVMALPLLAHYLPISFQRGLTWLPFVEFDSLATEQAQSSSEWRIDMWKNILPDLPEYFLIGKGCMFSGEEFINITKNGQGGDRFLLLGSYHNGPLQFIVKLGLIAFIFLLGLWVTVCRRHLRLARNDWRSRRLKGYHRIILAYFITQCLVYIFVCGSISGLPQTFFLIVILEQLVSSDLKIEAGAKLSA